VITVDKKTRNMVIGLFILAILTPLGLLASGDAFGEWELNDLKEKLGYAPSGMEKLSPAYNAPMPDYSLPGTEGSTGAALTYILSAVLGIILCAGALYLLGKSIARNG
jgi:hypothetical protein